MFEHSVKVPRIYKIAAKLLQEVKEKRGSLKQLIYQKKHANLRGIFALVAKTLKHISQIDTVIQKSQLLVKESRFDPWLARILISELVWNEKRVQNDSKPIKTILSYYDTLQKHKQALDSNVKEKNEQKVKKPRFVRINTLALTIEEAINGFREEGWTLMPCNKSYDDYLSEINCLGLGEFMIDLHIKELLLFPSNTEFYNHYAYKQGMVILQDKASCLPAHLLNPPPGSVVLDMCAAPGMKTSHLAALLNNEGIVYAVEKDEERFKTLNKIVQDTGAACVRTIHKDVLKVSADDCPDVEYILVDPSCSGSGITNRIEIEDEPLTVNPGRLKKLANFQTVILKHALTNFPQVKRVVYSTCSIYPEENENVIKEVEGFGSLKLVSARSLLNSPWKNMEPGHDDAIISKCLYTTPEKDLTNGFFIAVFERDVNLSDSSKKYKNDLSVINKQAKKNGAKHVTSKADEATTVDKANDSNLIENEDNSDNILSRKECKKRKAIEEENKINTTVEHSLAEVEDNSNNISGRNKHKKNKQHAVEEENKKVSTKKVSNVNLPREHKKKKKVIEEESKEATTINKTGEKNLMEDEDNTNISSKKERKKRKEKEVKEESKIITFNAHNVVESEDNSSSKKVGRKKKRNDIEKENEKVTTKTVNEANFMEAEDIFIEKKHKKKIKPTAETVHNSTITEVLKNESAKPFGGEDCISGSLLPTIKNKKKKKEKTKEKYMELTTLAINDSVVTEAKSDEKTVGGSKKCKKRKKKKYNVQENVGEENEHSEKKKNKMKKTPV